MAVAANLIELLLIATIDVNSNDYGAGGQLGRSIDEEARVVQLELANLIAHVVHDLVLIEIEHAKEPFHRLDGTRPTKVEADAGQNKCL